MHSKVRTLVVGATTTQGRPLNDKGGIRKRDRRGKEEIYATSNNFARRKDSIGQFPGAFILHMLLGLVHPAAGVSDRCALRTDFDAVQTRKAVQF
jgi:hypothetical protein